MVARPFGWSLRLTRKSSNVCHDSVCSSSRFLVKSRFEVVTSGLGTLATFGIDSKVQGNVQRSHDRKSLKGEWMLC